MGIIRSNQYKEGGFTLIELLIAIAISGIVIGSLFSFIIVQRKYFTLQGQITEMVQGARAAMDMMSNEIMVAGYNPTGATFSGIPYNASQLEIRADSYGSGNGVTTDPNEDIIYSYDATNKRIVRNTGGGNQPFAENVQAFTFDYLDALGNPTTVSANIRQIRITITVRTSKPDPQYSTNGGYRTYTLTSRVTARNLAY
jgi:type IV pilus assembly protein PilW